MLNSFSAHSEVIEEMRKQRLFSIGHSNHDQAWFLQLLQRTSITAVADVRSQPFSRRFPQFNWPELERALRALDIGYAFLGEFLGGRPRHLGLYDPEGQVDYERVRQTEMFQQGLSHLEEVLKSNRVALLCSEEDPLHCHRGLMIAPALVERGRAVWHLRGDGSVETARQAEDRLLAETGVGAGILDGLFAAAVTEEERSELLGEAYRMQARRRAFRLRPAVADEEENTKE
ncbi:MAG: DUF488 domain-containing protein [Planctomycetes bacterium]|nr:DUF488 domain-containing protein [Planctomycetota bacterium]